ncbi:hypothetical protein [Thermohalobacter berrensis]|uniref:hypothetical protein n=1 Tax=Thermohalobacter berrensis TaxID=99594 RepID=UPI000E74798B|nr:hypothetical protein [Thermohalobacter berrensis]
MEKFFGDLHIHIGYNEENQPVKITASKDLKFKNILHESLIRKGLGIVGIVDCASPRVLTDIKKEIKTGELKESPKGGVDLQR